MTNEKVSFEIHAVLSKDLCEEAVKILFKVRNKFARIISLILTAFCLYQFMRGIFYSIYFNNIQILYCALIFVIMSILWFFLFLRGYKVLPKNHKLRIDKMSSSGEHIYIFYVDRFEEKTDQSNRIINYVNIQKIINTKKLLIIVTQNSQHILVKDQFQNDFSAFFVFLRQSSHSKYIEK